MTLVAYFDLELYQMDVKTSVLNGVLDEKVYMEKPEGFCYDKGKKLVYKLKKSFYRLKQASQSWYLKFYNVVTSYGFIENIMDNLYIL
jgi:hypothetical protein